MSSIACYLTNVSCCSTGARPFAEAIILKKRVKVNSKQCVLWVDSDHPSWFVGLILMYRSRFHVFEKLKKQQDSSLEKKRKEKNHNLVVNMWKWNALVHALCFMSTLFCIVWAYRDQRCALLSGQDYFCCFMLYFFTFSCFLSKKNSGDVMWRQNETEIQASSQLILIESWDLSRNTTPKQLPRAVDISKSLTWDHRKC